MATKKRTEIECTECENMIRFPEYIGAEFRTGKLKCDKCGAELRIKLKKWEVVDYYPVEEKAGKKSKEPEQSEALKMIQELAREARLEEKESKKGDA
jgi:hypothetical protein